MDETRETPTQILAKTVNDTASHTDKRGRLITVNRLNALQFYRIAKVMGDTASNPTAMDLAVIACSVRRIDAVAIAIPATEREVELLMQQLDFDGLGAAGEALKKLNAEVNEDAEDLASKN